MRCAGSAASRQIGQWRGGTRSSARREQRVGRPEHRGRVAGQAQEQAQPCAEEIGNGHAECEHEQPL